MVDDFESHIDGPYTLIASGDIVDFADTTTTYPRRTKTVTPIEFANTTAYTYYQIVFPTLRPDSDGYMQIAEIELIGTVQESGFPDAVTRRTSGPSRPSR